MSVWGYHEDIDFEKLVMPYSLVSGAVTMGEVNHVGESNIGMSYLTGESIWLVGKLGVVSQFSHWSCPCPWAGRVP